MAQKEVDLEKAFFLKSVDDDGQRCDLTELVEKLEMLSINVKEAQERIHKVETIRQLKTMEPEVCFLSFSTVMIYLVISHLLYMHRLELDMANGWQ